MPPLEVGVPQVTAEVVLATVADTDVGAVGGRRGMPATGTLEADCPAGPYEATWMK